MKTVIGSAAGVMLLGLILMGLGFFGSSRDTARAFEAADNELAAPSDAADRREAEVAPTVEYGTAPRAAAPMLVNCGPGRQALVRQVSVDGGLVPQVDCVGASGVSSDAGVMYGRQVSDVQVLPASVYNERVAAGRARQLVTRQAPARTTQSKRGWKKPLLIIGGSSAAGAGVGGILGGKKGALIGAAIGGGASAIYEATRK